MLAALVLGSGCASTQSVGPDAECTAQPAWQCVLDAMTERAGTMSEHLDRAHEALTQRARLEDPSQLEKLTPTPPVARKSGYGLLPKITNDVATRPTQLNKTEYALQALAKDFVLDFERARQLSDSAANGALKTQVDEFDYLRKRKRFLDDLIAYHRFWQNAVIEHAQFFEERRLISQLVKQLEGTQDPKQQVELRSQIQRVLAPFAPTKGLSVRPTSIGLVLRLPITTDIQDRTFLIAFEKALDTVFNTSRAARGADLSIKIAWNVVAPESLYPSGAPEIGTAIDEKDHLQRFGADNLILTTGAKSTHAFVGKSIVLGSEPISARALAHEACHLLGFADAYLRVAEGDPQGPWGSVLIEWTGLLNDLMGAPSHGVVTDEMVRLLLKAYAPAG